MTGDEQESADVASLRQTVDQMLAESQGLRSGVSLPHLDAGPKELADTLLNIRARLDRLEWLIQRLMRVRGYLRRQAEQLREIADDAWDKAITQQRGAPVTRDDYSTGRERHAYANLAVVDELRAARQAEQLSAWCAERVEIMRFYHRGLTDTRQDVLALLRVFQFESNLER